MADLFDVVVARKLSGGGGGGGSSDFSTAEVTLNPALGKPIEIAVPYINWNNLLMSINEPIQENDTITVPLYHNSVIAILTSIGSISISGDIEDVGEGAYIITGDCTITIS